MAVAAAEQLQYTDYYAETPLVFAIPELDQDNFIRHQAARFIGSVAVGEAVSITPAEMSGSTTTSLMEAINRTAEGDATARKMVETNVRTDVIERTIKAGHILSVPLEIDEHGKIKQYGQTLEDVQANSLRFAASDTAMRARTEAETRNSFRLEQAQRAGLLDDYHFVVFSRAADDMSPEAMRNAGFFIDTQTAVIQVVSSKNGGLQIESAFVAGKKTPESPRHDAETFTKVGQSLSIELDGLSATELLDTPLLIHKSVMPNGAIDLVALYDECAGGTFFGEAKQTLDYAVYAQSCIEREQQFTPKIMAITEQLLSEAKTFQTPVQATRRLHELSERAMVQQAAFDYQIDPMVFGEVAAAHIVTARIAFESGDMQQVLESVTSATKTAQSSSCPTGMFGGSQTTETGNGESVTNTSESNEDCEFVSKKCPLCGEKNVKTKVTKHGIEGECGCKVKK